MTAEIELDPAAIRRQQRLVLILSIGYAVIGILFPTVAAAVVLWARGSCP